MQEGKKGERKRNKLNIRAAMSCVAYCHFGDGNGEILSGASEKHHL